MYVLGEELFCFGGCWMDASLGLELLMQLRGNVCSGKARVVTVLELHGLFAVMSAAILSSRLSVQFRQRYDALR